MRELATGNFDFLFKMDTKQISNFPKYLQNEIHELLSNINKMSELERRYFSTQITFVVREMFAQKIGAFSDLSHSAINNLGFSSF